jgi:hypothetical protein
MPNASERAWESVMAVVRTRLANNNVAAKLPTAIGKRRMTRLESAGVDIRYHCCD